MSRAYIRLEEKSFFPVYMGSNLGLVSNSVLCLNESFLCMPIKCFGMVLLLWTFFCLPLFLLGNFLVLRFTNSWSVEEFTCAIPKSQVNRRFRIRHPLVFALSAGIISFSGIVVELSYFLSSLWTCNFFLIMESA